MRSLSTRGAGLLQGRNKLIWIVSLVVGVTVLATTALATFHLVRLRRRRSETSTQGFRQACLRDPSLTWEEYERKGRLTRSRLFFEEDIQRSIMIRKSQQSRTSDRKHDGTGHGSGSTISSSSELQQQQQQQPGRGIGPPPAGQRSSSPSRSKSWHGRGCASLRNRDMVEQSAGGGSGSGSGYGYGYGHGYGHGYGYHSPPPFARAGAEGVHDSTHVGGGGGGDGDGGSVALGRDVLADWNSVHASVERTWQLLHGRKFPTLNGPSSSSSSSSSTSSPSTRTARSTIPTQSMQQQQQQQQGNDDLEDPPRPPTVRLKTPPLLSHPMFRDQGPAQHRPKHMSLPTELTRAKSDSSSVAGRGYLSER